MAAGARIQAIDKTIVHRICSGQVILDLATAVKELVENALDAGASNIEVRLKDHGAESIEVADNGTGISPTDYHALTLKYHTSKLKQFTDLQDLNSFGFRGEALSSLCALADVYVVTRQADQSAGVKLEFDHTGNLKGTTAAARSIGTTVCVKNLFKPLPVRFKEFKRNVKKEYSKMIILLQAYALISTGVRIICTSQTGNGARSTVVSTQAAQSVRDNIVTIFGPRTADGLEALEVSTTNGLKLSVWVSKGTAGMSRATGDRQFLFLNGRPIDLPKANKMINETFRSLASPALAHHKPAFVINIIAPPQSYDVNVTPDKRKVFLQDEAHILSVLQEALNGIWEPTRSRYEVNGTQPSAKHRSKRRRTSTEGDSEDSEGDAAEEEDVVNNENDPEVGPKGGGPSQGTPTVTPAYQKRIARNSILSALQRSAGQGYRSSPLGEPRRSSAGTPVLRSGSKESTPHQTLHSRFTGFSSGATQSAGKQPPSGSSPISLSPEKAAPEETRQNPLAGPPLEREVMDLDLEDLNGDCSLTARSPSPDSQAKAEAPDLTSAPAAAINEDRSMEAAESPENVADSLQASDVSGVPSSPGSPMADEESCQPTSGSKRKRDGPADEDQSKTQPKEVSLIETSNDMKGSDVQPQDVEQDGGLQIDLDAFQESPSAEASSGQLVAQVDLESLRKKWQKRRKRSAHRSPSQNADVIQFQAATLQGKDLSTDLQPADSANLSAAASELERVFEKSQFRQLEILGQFNLGFILARLGNDLFIIDQHASDEKFNFERLTKTTQLSRQPLLQPQALDLTPSEAVVIRDHLDIFSKNGFELEDKEGRLFLKGVPYSQNVSFGAADVQELAQLLNEAAPSVDREKQMQSQRAVNVSDRIPRPSRVRSMLAMRACRSSIMIGKTLDSRTMRQIVDHLSELDSPWNCPHGRPTMRHLAVLPRSQQWHE